MISPVISELNFSAFQITNVWLSRNQSANLMSSGWKRNRYLLEKQQIAESDWKKFFLPQMSFEKFESF